ncbi:DUF2892 domain-containing protein [Devosia sp. XJ19-1]|uniref:DUF2892 domain-containing protein n=1 Tax=Devosia ureilytica TaxID=2952754 RepID=A0A9Q4FSN2_9HYPH|nr:DUF2892 domain-containing protein [Devosia ureilytica]MCP8883889.1 DUF2892 domain-containing protein [Devosia ureilytica]MCP8887497.1 DUF2892 domain-containing protein [Devosia ureilytica]
MLYRKNIYEWEQRSRVAAGIAMAVWGFAFAPNPILGYTIAVAGIGLAITGVFGWCPACAMIGRRLKD